MWRLIFRCLFTLDILKLLFRKEFSFMVLSLLFEFLYLLI